MTDLISRADVLKYPIRLDHYDEEHGNRDFVLGIESVMEYVESLPSADAVQGEWIHDGQNFKGGLDWCHCSECGCKTSANGLSMYNYCPNCGARMKGGAE